MTEFFVCRTNYTIGPDFNAAAKILQDIKGLEVKQAMAPEGVFKVEASDDAMREVTTRLRGWSTDKVGQYGFPT